jgi:hypothetical protein
MMEIDWMRREAVGKSKEQIGLNGDGEMGTRVSGFTEAEVHVQIVKTLSQNPPNDYVIVSNMKRDLRNVACAKKR